MTRMQPDYLPSKEEIKERIKQMKVLRDSGLSIQIIESVMLYAVPSYDLVVHILSTHQLIDAEEILYQQIHDNSRIKKRT